MLNFHSSRAIIIIMEQTDIGVTVEQAVAGFMESLRNHCDGVAMPQTSVRFILRDIERRDTLCIVFEKVSSADLYSYVPTYEFIIQDGKSIGLLAHTMYYDDYDEKIGFMTVEYGVDGKMRDSWCTPFPFRMPAKIIGGPRVEAYITKIIGEGGRIPWYLRFFFKPYSTSELWGIYTEFGYQDLNLLPQEIYREEAFIAFYDGFLARSGVFPDLREFAKN